MSISTDTKLCNLDCLSRMGIIRGEILSTQLSASSRAHHYSGPEFGRLNIGLGYGAWCAAKQDKNQYLQVGIIGGLGATQVRAGSGS